MHYSLECFLAKEPANEITLSIVVPQLFFILLSAIAVSVGVSRALVPLKNLRDSLHNRSQYDLTPIAEDGTPSEVQPLVVAINELMMGSFSSVEMLSGISSKFG